MDTRNLRKQGLFSTLLIATLLLMAGCGSDNGDTQIQDNEAYLHDSFIQGMDYTTQSKSGKTLEGGKFEYSPADIDITFAIGSLKIGTYNISDINSDKKLFVNSLLGLDRNNTSDANLTKLLVLLQSLDFDDNATNGIVITDNIKGFFGTSENIKDLNSTQISSRITTAGKTEVTKLNAKKHFQETLTKEIGLTFNTVFWKDKEYNIVTSPDTNKSWLDRHLGASEVCTKSRDDSAEGFDDASYVVSQKNCFGDLYQWGRNTDGHENNATGNLELNSTQAASLTNAGAKFITDSSFPTDWADGLDNDGSLRSANWSKADGTSVCPIGFRVPTEVELTAETTGSSSPIGNRDDAFNNFLKLPASGYRLANGVLNMLGDGFGVVTTTLDGTEPKELYVDGTSANFDTASFASATAVRCIKD